MEEGRTTGHSRWITTRQKLQGDPEALAAYEKKRDEVLAYIDENAEAIEAEAQADDRITALPGSWPDGVPAADGRVRYGGITFISEAHHAEFRRALKDAELADQIREGVAEAESGTTKYLGSFAEYLDDGDDVTRGPDLADYADYAEAQTEEDQAAKKAMRAQYGKVLEARTAEEDKAASKIQQIRNRWGLSYDTSAKVAAHITQEEHDAAWQKIIADQAAEEQVRDRLAAAHAKAQQELGEEFAEYAEESAEWAKLTEAVHAEDWDDDTPDPNERTRKAAQRLKDHVQSEPMWLLWSNAKQQWWMPRAEGYTDDKNKAGRFTGSEVLAMYRHSAAGWDPSENNLLPSSVIVPDA